MTRRGMKMRQKSQTRQTGAAKAIKDIRRATRKEYSAEEKIRIVLLSQCRFGLPLRSYIGLVTTSSPDRLLGRRQRLGNSLIHFLTDIRSHATSADAVEVKPWPVLR